MTAKVHFLTIAATVLAAGLAGAHAQNQFLLGVVQTPDSRPVSHQYVVIEPNLGPFETTDSGRFEFPLDKNLQVGHDATFIIQPSKEKRWVIVKPCDHRNGRIFALPAAGTVPVEIFAAAWGSRDLGKSIAGCAVEEYASTFKRRPGAERNLSLRQDARRALAAILTGERNSPSAKKARRFSLVEAAYSMPGNGGASRLDSTDLANPPNPQLDLFLAGKAMELGIAAEDLRAGIEAWTASGDDLYEKGLAAFYKGYYAEASREIAESIKSATGDVLKRYVPLARAEFEQAHYAAAEAALRKVVAVHGDDPLVLNSLGLVLTARANYSEAEPVLKQALILDEKSVGPDHPEVAKNLNSLAYLYYEQGKYAETEPLLQRALAIDEKALGPNHPNVAAILNSLALLYAKQHKYVEAEPLLQRALAINEKILGPKHVEVAKNMNNLGDLYYQQGKYIEAEPLLQRALAINEKTLGPQHAEVAKNLNNLANVYSKQRKYAEAEPLLQRAVAVNEKTLGPDHPEVVNNLNNLAYLYYAQGKYGDAEPLFQRVLTINEKTLGPQHAEVANNLAGLGEIYRAQHKYADAEPLFKRALAIDEKAVPPDHPTVANHLTYLAHLYYDQDKCEEAASLYKRALAIDEKALGPNDATIAAIATGLAATLHKLGREAEAKEYEEKAASYGTGTK